MSYCSHTVKYMVLVERKKTSFLAVGLGVEVRGLELKSTLNCFYHGAGRVGRR